MESTDEHPSLEGFAPTTGRRALVEWMLFSLRAIRAPAFLALVLFIAFTTTRWGRFASVANLEFQRSDGRYQVRDSDGWIATFDDLDRMREVMLGEEPPEITGVCRITSTKSWIGLSLPTGKPIGPPAMERTEYTTTILATQGSTLAVWPSTAAAAPLDLGRRWDLITREHTVQAPERPGGSEALTAGTASSLIDIEAELPNIVETLARAFDSRSNPEAAAVLRHRSAPTAVWNALGVVLTALPLAPSAIIFTALICARWRIRRRHRLIHELIHRTAPGTNSPDTIE